MFYTLTANPAVDMTVSSSPLEPDENVRTGSASYTANGKGLDVSFAFKKMGVDTVALGFFAGFTGKFIVEEVMNLGCLCRPVWTDGITRINTYVNDGQHEYGILNPGAPITPQHQEELYNILDTAGDLECLIVSGSVPPKATPDFLAQVMEHAQARGADVVLDLSSDKLKELAHKKPLLIKPIPCGSPPSNEGRRSASRWESQPCGREPEAPSLPAPAKRAMTASRPHYCSA